jgi:hypothetical protein
LRVTELCRRRSIRHAEIKTPLLVPSFSSRGFPDVGEIHCIMRDYL